MARATTLLIVLTLAAAPVPMLACATLCGGQSLPAAPMAECREHASASTEFGPAACAHACDELLVAAAPFPVDTQRSLTLSAAQPAVVITLFSHTSAVVTETRVVIRGPTDRPPAALSLAANLRI